jgi:hypothetical protein
MKKIKHTINIRNCTMLFLIIYAILVSVLAVTLGIQNDAFRTQLQHMQVDVSWLKFQFDLLQFITDMCIFVFIYAIAVIIYSFRENRKEGENMGEPRQVGYVELINGRQIAYTYAERMAQGWLLTLPSGSTMTLLDAEIGRWL